MGLLSHIEKADYEKKYSVSSLNFNDFQNKYSVNILSIYKKTDDSYKLIKCFGYDLKTIFKSKIDAGYIDELLVFEKKVYTFSIKEEQIEPIVNTFSFSIQDNIEYLNLYRFNDFLLLVNSNEPDKPNLELIFEELSYFTTTYNLPVITDDNTDYYDYTISLNEVIKDCIKNGSGDDYFSQAIYSQIIYNLCLYFPKPDFIKETGENTLKISIKAKNPISTGLLTIQLQKNFEEFLQDSSNKIEVF